MANESFFKAYKDAAKELESLVTEQERIEKRILSLRKTMNALETVISQLPEAGNIGDMARASLILGETSLTDDIAHIIATTRVPLTASEIKTQLTELGVNIAEHSNPLATIHSILGRLTESGRAHETVRNGKKAWERMTRMGEAFQKSRAGKTTGSVVLDMIRRTARARAEKESK